ncbi:unnamed protein product [Urochloa humidicola]
MQRGVLLLRPQPQSHSLATRSSTLAARRSPLRTKDNQAATTPVTDARRRHLAVADKTENHDGTMSLRGLLVLLGGGSKLHVRASCVAKAITMNGCETMVYMHVPQNQFKSFCLEMDSTFDLLGPSVNSRSEKDITLVKTDSRMLTNPVGVDIMMYIFTKSSGMC